MRLFTIVLLLFVSHKLMSQIQINSVSTPKQVLDWDYYSCVSKRAEGKKTFIFSYDSVIKKPVSLSVQNLPIFLIVSKAYEDIMTWNESKIIIESKRKEQIMSWSDDNLWNYQIKVRPEEYKSFYRYIRQDIERYFGLKTFIEKRKVPSLVLIKIGDLNKITSHDTSSRGTYKAGKDGKRFLNSPMKALVDFIQMNNKRPVVDETNFLSRFDLTIKSSFSDLNSLREELRLAGLDLIEDEREVDMIIVGDGDK